MDSFDLKKNIEDSILKINHNYYVKRKTTKGVHVCYTYHETCSWNSEWFPCQRLCSLQKMDKRVIQKIFLALIRAIK